MMLGWLRSFRILFYLLNILCMSQGLYAPLSEANLIAYKDPSLRASLTLPKVPSPKVSSISQSSNIIAAMFLSSYLIINYNKITFIKTNKREQFNQKIILNNQKYVNINIEQRRAIEQFLAFYNIQGKITIIEVRKNKWVKKIMQKQVCCNNLVLKSIQDLNKTKQKVGSSNPAEMEQISKMFTPSKNSSFLFQNIGTHKNIHLKAEQSLDQISIKNAFFRRYAEITIGKDRVVEDNGFDLFMLGNKSKSLNVKNCVNGDQNNLNVDNIIPRNRFLALNKILKLKSPKKLQPLQTLNNLKMDNSFNLKQNTSLTSKKTIKTQEDEHQMSKSIKKNRLLPVFSEQYRNAVLSRNQSANLSPALSFPSVCQSPNQRHSQSPSPSPSPIPSTPLTYDIDNEIPKKLIAIKPMRKFTVNKIKQAIYKKQTNIKQMQQNKQLKSRQISSNKNNTKTKYIIIREQVKLKKWVQAKKRYNDERIVFTQGNQYRENQNVNKDYVNRYGNFKEKVKDKIMERQIENIGGHDKDADSIKGKSKQKDKSPKKGKNKSPQKVEANSQKGLKDENRHKKIYTPLQPWHIEVEVDSACPDFLFQGM